MSNQLDAMKKLHDEYINTYVEDDPGRRNELMNSVMRGMTPLKTNEFDALMQNQSDNADFCVIVFWDGNCTHCFGAFQGFQPFAGKTCQIFTVNRDEEPELASRFAIKAVPTIALFTFGSLFDLYRGRRVPEEIEQWFEIPNKMGAKWKASLERRRARELDQANADEANAMADQCDITTGQCDLPPGQ